MKSFNFIALYRQTFQLFLSLETQTAAVSLPVVQPLLQVLEVQSFLGNPEKRKSSKVDCMHV